MKKRYHRQGDETGPVRDGRLLFRIDVSSTTLYLSSVGGFVIAPTRGILKLLYQQVLYVVFEVILDDEE